MLNMGVHIGGLPYLTKPPGPEMGAENPVGPIRDRKPGCRSPVQCILFQGVDRPLDFLISRQPHRRLFQLSGKWIL